MDTFPLPGLAEVCLIHLSKTDLQYQLSLERKYSAGDYASDVLKVCHPDPPTYPQDGKRKGEGEIT